MDGAATIYYWARVGAVVLVALLGLGLGVRRSREKSPSSDLIFGVIGAVGLGVAILLGVHLNYLLSAALLVAGVALGFFVGGVRWLFALLTAIAYVFAAIMVMFGEGLAAAFGIAIIAFAVGTSLGQGVRRTKPEIVAPSPEA